jgi:aconitate hydratase
MVRGTFDNIHVQNEMTPEKQGGWTIHEPSKELLTIYEAHNRYAQENRPLIVVAGKEYGTGSSRDWAAKGPYLLGVRVILAESFERIHRSNLIGMGILPLQFQPGEDRKTFGLDGSESVDILQFDDATCRQGLIKIHFSKPNGVIQAYKVISRIDTANELSWFKSGGVMPYILDKLRQV